MGALQPNYHSTPGGESQPFQENVRKFASTAGFRTPGQPRANKTATFRCYVMRHVAGMYLRLRNVAIAQMADPVRGDRDIVVKNLYASICGTDVAVLCHEPHNHRWRRVRT